MTIRATILIASLAAVASAQTPAPAAGPVSGQAMRQNLEKLKQYTHKRRIRIEVRGDVRSTRVDQVRYADGKMATLPLEAPPPRSEPTGRLRRRVAEKKREEFKEYARQLTSLLQGYLMPDPEKLRSQIDHASIQRTGSGTGANVQIVMHDFVKHGDSFTLVWSAAQRHPVRTEIKTDLDKKPIGMTIEYQDMPEGPWYPAQVVLTAKNKDMRVLIDNYDYELAGAH
jgi:hypothetical protein